MSARKVISRFPHRSVGVVEGGVARSCLSLRKRPAEWLRSLGFALTRVAVSACSGPKPASMPRRGRLITARRRVVAIPRLPLLEQGRRRCSSGFTRSRFELLSAASSHYQELTPLRVVDDSSWFQDVFRVFLRCFDGVLRVIPPCLDGVFVLPRSDSTFHRSDVSVQARPGNLPDTCSCSLYLDSGAAVLNHPCDEPRALPRCASRKCAGSRQLN